MNPSPDPDPQPDYIPEISRDPPAPVLYWQQSYYMPIFIHVRLDLVLTQQALVALLAYIWLVMHM